MFRMCGRFALSLSFKKLLTLFPKSEPFTWDPCYNIAPQSEVPFLINEHHLKLADWGFHMPQFSKCIINARAETLKEKPLFKKLWPGNRCALITSGFFEWKKKVPHYIHLPKGEELYLGALYRFAANGKLEFVILTEEVNGALADLHHRKPLMLRGENLKGWFSKEYEISNPLKEEELIVYPVSSKMNKTAYNTPSCLLEEKTMQHDLFLDFG